MSVPILIFLCMLEVYSDSHFLQLLYTGVSGPGYGIPQFSVVGYVDDQLAELYSSDIGRSVPVAPWMKNEDPKYWKTETRINKEQEAVFKHEVKLVMDRLNHTEGFHFGQAMVKCELRDDGSTKGYALQGYDGKEFMYLDVLTATYIPTMVEAHLTAQRWNSPDVRMGERVKNYLENICLERLRRYVERGREVLERRVRPQVKVSGQEKGDDMMLHCQVYGFHPRAVDVMWIKNGEDEVPSYETTHVLPNPDGTYQIRVSVEVTPKEGDRYSCNVHHSSLEAPLLVQWEPNWSYRFTAISSVVIIILLLVLAVAAACKQYTDLKLHSFLHCLVAIPR